ncbi:MAG TPA: MBL fold metallo-hydrolase [Xanthobacteraceae bacterium]|nr:MBL fold metallo-hydrolase [Xanthobacteraceae bacterium]
MPLTFTILGCGSSGGVPRVGQGWGACDPNNPKNRRRRCSLLVERADGGRRTRVLVDTSPDLREQLLDADVARLDGVIFTHEHADHTHGIDDLRPLALVQRRRIDVYLDARTSAFLHRRFGYCFKTPEGSEYPPILQEHRMEAGKTVKIEGEGGAIEALPFELRHGNAPALGLRFGGLAYTPDVSDFTEESFAALADLDVWLIDALRERPHPSHLTVEEALGWIARLHPRRAILTNLHTDLDYETLSRGLPPNVEPAYDGMRINVD